MCVMIGWDWVDRLFCAFFHAVQLVLPIALESFSELVQRADGRGVGAIETVAAVAADAHKIDMAQYAEVLGDGRLVEADGCDNFAHLVLIVRQKEEDLPAPGLGNRVEGVGGGCCPGHGEDNTCRYRNMSSKYFVTFVRAGTGMPVGLWRGRSLVSDACDEVEVIGSRPSRAWTGHPRLC